MKAKFYLRKSSEKSIINFEFRSGTKIKFRPSTGFKINNVKDWDSVKQRMKIPSSNFNANLINSKLSEFDNLLNDLVYRKGELGVGLESVTKAFYAVFDLDGKSSRKFQNDCFKVELEDGDNSKNFLLYFEWFLDFYATNNSPYSKKILTKGTLRTLRSSMNVINGFIKYKKIKNLYFDDINRNFYNDFIFYLTNERKYSKNYIGTVIQKLKTVMSYAYEENKHTNLEYKKNYFSKVSEDINHPYLCEEELFKIEKLILNDSELDTVRDIFLLGCNTASRITDLLNWINNPTYVFQGKIKLIKMRQLKTGNIVFIPINSFIKRILDKRNGNLPNYLHQNKINEHIKSICKRAKIVEIYKYFRTEGGLEVEHSGPKFKFICTHTARRSFCTNAYNSGMPPHDIMAISGHKKEDLFYKYIKVEKQVNAIRISNYPFLQ